MKSLCVNGQLVCKGEPQEGNKSIWEHPEAVHVRRMQGQILGGPFWKASMSSTAAGRKELLPDKAAEVRRLTHRLLSTGEALRASHLRLNGD